MDYLLYNPFPKWIVCYIIRLQNVPEAYFMSRQLLGLFSYQKGKV